MKKASAICTGILFCTIAFGQQKEGKVVYERNMQMQITISGGAGMENNLPKSRKDKHELNFADNKMSIRQLEESLQDENLSSGNMVIRTIGAGADDVVFCDFSAARRVEARELFDKKFLISDSIRRGSWKLTDDTKKILDLNCRKATSTRIAKRSMMSMENGEMKRREIDDTSLVVAWFTMDVPVPAGPEMQGQLPGLVLELEIGTRVVYTAIEFSPKADMKALKEPTKGKKVTPEEYTKERVAMMDEMQRNNPGGNMRIRMN